MMHSSGILLLLAAAVAEHADNHTSSHDCPSLTTCVECIGVTDVDRCLFNLASGTCGEITDCTDPNECLPSDPYTSTYGDANTLELVCELAPAFYLMDTPDKELCAAASGTNCETCRAVTTSSGQQDCLWQDKYSNCRLDPGSSGRRRRELRNDHRNAQADSNNLQGYPTFDEILSPETRLCKAERENLCAPQTSCLDCLKYESEEDVTCAWKGAKGAATCSSACATGENDCYQAHPQSSAEEQCELHEKSAATLRSKTVVAFGAMAVLLIISFVS